MYGLYSNFLEKEFPPPSSTAIEAAKPEKSMANSLFMLSCYYCDNSTTWNDNLTEIFDHWSLHHSNNKDSPFLFHITYKKSKLFEPFAATPLTNSQLKRLSSIKSTSKHSNSNSELENDKNFVRYLACDECEKKLSEMEYYEHIEMHANEFKAKKDESDPKTRLKSIYSNTKVVFSNGLVLAKQNLSTTHLGDCEKFDKFIDTLFSIKNPSSVSGNDSDLSTELKLQMRQMNVLKIYRIKVTDEQLKEIFLRICRQLKISIRFDVDVNKIYRVSPETIAVEFNDIKKKDEIFNCYRIKLLYTNHIFEDVSKDQSKKIVFTHHLTQYFYEIEMHLVRALKEGRIHSFRLTTNGFLLQKKKYCDAEVVLSIKQFNDIMKNEN